MVVVQLMHAETPGDLGVPIVPTRHGVYHGGTGNVYVASLRSIAYTRTVAPR